MNRFPQLAVLGTLVILLSTACSPQAPSAPVDSIATSVAQGVLAAGSQTALAYSMLPTATETPTPAPTDTATSAPTPQPMVIHMAPCWFGPGPAYNLESNIKHGETVELLAVGTVPGWYIIRNPYFHQPCWIQAENLDVGPDFHAGEFPLMTPWPTRVVPTETPRKRNP